MDDILDLGWHSCAICYDDQPPLTKVGLPWVALPTFLNSQHSRVFQDGRCELISDSHSSCLEEPNVNEKEWAMGFHIGTKIVSCLLKGACKCILG
jgi:hypothetical protein